MLLNFYLITFHEYEPKTCFILFSYNFILKLFKLVFNHIRYFQSFNIRFRYRITTLSILMYLS